MIHKDTKDVVTRTEALMLAFGWKGGTIHQIAEETGCDAHDLIYKPAEGWNNDNAGGVVRLLDKQPGLQSKSYHP